MRRSLLVSVCLLFLGACSAHQNADVRTTPSIASVTSVASVAQADSLPPIPESVPSPLGPVPIVWGDSLLNEQGRPIVGGYSPGQRTIYLHTILRNRLPVAHSVLAHEWCHVWIVDAGLQNLINPQLVDAICDAYATARVHQMLAALKR